MNNYTKCQKGLSLTELLATIVIISIISVLTTSLFTMALNNFKKVSAENALRDEADLILAQFYKEIYPLKQSNINENTAQPAGFNYLTYNGSVKSGFSNSSVFIACTQNDVTKCPTHTFASNTELITSSKDSRNFSSIDFISPRTYSVKLVLKNKEKNLVRTYTFDISILKDIK